MLTAKTREGSFGTNRQQDRHQETQPCRHQFDVLQVIDGRDLARRLGARGDGGTWALGADCGGGPTECFDAPLLKIFWRETRVAGNAGHHPRTDLLVVVEGEDVVWPPFSLKHAV